MTSRLPEKFLGKGDEFLKYERGFSSETDPRTKTSFSFLTGITEWEFYGIFQPYFSGFHFSYFGLVFVKQISGKWK
jgi:hypothetical protein